MSAEPEPEPADLFVKFPIELLDLVADEKLTLNAAYLYMLLLTHINYKRGDADVWPSRSSLARRMRLTQSRAVDRYIKELIDAGLVKREHRRDGRVNDTNRYTLAVVCWPKVDDKSPGGSAPQRTTPSALERTTLVRQSAHELDEPQLDKEQLDQRSDQSSPDASGVGDDGGDDFSDPFADVQPASTAAQLTKKRDDDRANFRAMIEATHLRSDGSKFTEGVFTVDQFYDAFRKRKRPKPIGFPGAYVEPMYAANPDNGVQDWLLSLGLEPV